jgi:hypothetical protein
MRFRPPRIHFNDGRFSRLRGKRRYYARLRQQAQAFDPGLDRDVCLWHVHADDTGCSWIHPRHLRSHLEALFVMFRRTLEISTRVTRPHQVWIQIQIRNPRGNTLYVHTTGDDRTPFPNRMEDVEWGVPPPPVVSEYVRGEDWVVGRLRLPARVSPEGRRCSGTGDTLYVIYSPRHGLSLR